VTEATVSGRIRPTLRTAIVSTLVFGVATAVFAVTGSYPLAVALLVLSGAANLAAMSIGQTLVQLMAPPATRGRVIGRYAMSAKRPAVRQRRVLWPSRRTRPVSSRAMSPALGPHARRNWSGRSARRRRLGLRVPLVQAAADLLRRVRLAPPLVARDHDARGGDARDPGEPEQFPHRGDLHGS
jgi:hypothetical protein